MRRIVIVVAAAVALAALTVSTATTASAHRARHASKVVVRPVHANGRPVAGYRVRTESVAGFRCYVRSPSAVSRNIDFCGYSATYTVSCWKSTRHTVLCLRNPRVRKLVRIRYVGRFPHVSKPPRPSPQSIVLSNRRYCLIRDGGAWGSVKGHPSWVGFYGCGAVSVFGPLRGDGINRSVQPWRVHVVRGFSGGRQTIHNHRVRKAYYVGTAR